ncbi:MAG: Hsp20/alpha crystallin family protein [Candidatus Delongbacteria bacterium]|nr:Hsp20/alpha crystallin family protein [Candidatus Delongbacteria bacterium]
MSLIKRPYDLFGLKSDVNRVFDGLFGENWDTPAGSSWTPVVDISDDKDNLYVSAEVPGMDKDEIKVNIKNHLLTICGEKKTNQEEKDKNYYRSERSYGMFCRSFELPDTLAADKIEAEYRNGVLKLTIPKREEAKPREIEVKIK